MKIQEGFGKKEFPDNRFPECVFLKIQPVEKISNSVDLHLTINFDETKQRFKLGTVWFGLRGGDLNVDIKNGRILYESRLLKKSFDIELKIKREMEVDEIYKQETARSGSGEIGIKAGSLKSSRSKSDNMEDKKRIHDSFEYNLCQITTKGTETNPIWSFKSKTGEKYLIGSLVDKNFGTINIEKKPFCAVVTFVAFSRDIIITGTSGIWPDKITTNKKSIIEILLKRWLEYILNPYLSQDILKYG